MPTFTGRHLQKDCLLLTTIFSLLVCQATAQKIKFNLELVEDTYMGTMTPKWFDRIQIRTPTSNKMELVGAVGLMEGSEFPNMRFIIGKNKTGTSDLLMIKTSNGWYPITRLDHKKHKLKLYFDWGFRPVTRPVDLEVLKHAKDLISDEDSWNNKDDRICDEDFENEKWSLYCVLKQAYLNVTEDFNHRGAALNKLRSNIAALNPDRKYDHQLMEFNNERNFQEVTKLLSVCIDEMEIQLKLNSIDFKR